MGKARRLYRREGSQIGVHKPHKPFEIWSLHPAAVGTHVLLQ